MRTDTVRKRRIRDDSSGGEEKLWRKGDGEGVAFGEGDALVPVGVGSGESGGVIEALDLAVGEAEVGGDEILFELFGVARADDDGCDGGFAEEPAERNLRDGFSGFFGDGVERVDYFETYSSST